MKDGIEITLNARHLVKLHSIKDTLLYYFCTLFPGSFVMPFAGELLHHLVRLIFRPIGTDTKIVLLAMGKDTGTSKKYGEKCFHFLSPFQGR
jgi:hypothetical protein